MTIWHLSDAPTLPQGTGHVHVQIAIEYDLVGDDDKKTGEREQRVVGTIYWNDTFEYLWQNREFWEHCNGVIRAWAYLNEFPTNVTSEVKV